METDTAKQIYTPHLKKVLRSFQASAHTSLHGPNSVMGLWSSGGSGSEKTSAESSAVAASSVTASTAKSALKSPEDEPFTAPPPFPIQQPPIFTPPDQSGCEKTETVLENETISCFTVGGEKRLCLPQILNTVLRDFSLQQINCVCDNLHIFCSRCTSEQLEVLKSTGILPLSAPSCGLITKSDAERLCSALLDSNPPKVIRNPDVKLPFVVKVYHECFGQGTGLYAPDLYIDPMARCIECVECHGLFCPQKFVCHAHHPRENRTCHWGFDSFNWRSYLLLHSEQENDQQMLELFKEMKSRYDYGNDYPQKYKRKQILADGRDASKKVRMENFYPYPYTLDPGLFYWYPNPAWNKVAPFKPLPPVITRDEKPFFIAPEALPHFLRERTPYFLHDPSLLQNADHVLPVVEGDRYETHYQANVTYGPAAVKKYELKKDFLSDVQSHASQGSRQLLETVAKKPALKQEHKTSTASCYLDSEDTFSDTSSSTLSGTDDGLALAVEEAGGSPPPVAEDICQITSLLSESGVESSVCTKIISEVEAVISRYRKCLKASIQGKKLVQMEFEKVHSRQRQKILKLKEINRYLEKEMLRLQVDAAKTKSESSCSTSECAEKKHQTTGVELSSATSGSPGEKMVGEIHPVDSPCEETEKDSEVEAPVSESTAKTSQPKERVNVKVEPAGK